MHEQMARLYEAAEKLKGISGQSDLARELNVSPQTVNNWESRGVSKQGMLTSQRIIGCSAVWLETGRGAMHIAELRRVEESYFAAEPSTEEYERSTEGPLSFNEIEKIIVKVISNNAKGITNAADIAQEAARKILARGGATGSVSGQFIFASPEEIELLELFKKTNPSGRKSILNAVRGIQAGEPVAENVESFPLQRSAGSMRQ